MIYANRFSTILIAILVAFTARAQAWLPDGSAPTLDTAGEHINAHGGAILRDADGTYYWYGENRRKGMPQAGVACYSSPDLRSWTNRGIVMAAEDSADAIIRLGSTIERPKVVYCPATGQYVMWFHHELSGQGYGAAHAAVAVADNPLGPFTPLRSGRVNAGIAPEGFRPADIPEGADTLRWWTPEWYAAVDAGMFVARDLPGGQMARDMTIFVDDDGRAYHIYSSEENLTLHIAELDSTFTAHTGRYYRVAPGGHNEAPTIFRRNGRYVMITSGCTGWDPNAARLLIADSLAGPWTILPNPCRGEGADRTFGGQGTFILPLDDSLIFMADIWKSTDLPASRHLWIPITFTPDGLPILSPDFVNTSH